MPGPSWLGYAFAALMMGVGTYGLVRLVALAPLGRRRHVDVNTGHTFMALAMVGMLVPRWNVLPVGLWEVVFAVLAAWFLARAGRVVARRGLVLGGQREGSHVRHYLIYMAMACSMLYMYWLGIPVTSGGGGAAMGGSTMSGPPAAAGDPGLTLFLVLVLLASAVWQLDGIERTAPAHELALVGAGGAAPGTPGGGLSPADPEARPWLAPRLEVGCHVAMCVTMAYMLVLMV